MSAIESKGNFLIFRETLTEIERLVDVRDIILRTDRARTFIGEAIICMLELLTEYDVNTTESNVIEELERLAEMRVKIAQQDRGISNRTELAGGRILDTLINSKIVFVKGGPFSRLGSGGGVDPMTALERLAVVQRKISSYDIEDLLEFKINEASRKQENPKRDLPNKCEESKTTAKFASSPLSWLQDQDDILASDDDSSAIDGGELTPTSTIVSELPDFTDR